MTQGVSIATKKDGTVYYRAGLYYKNKHISLGSYADETTAYLEALAILGSLDQLPEDYIEQPTTLSFEKIIVLLNFRNNGIYFKNPIYLRNGYFSYYLSRIEELKFDVDDLFYYSSRKIQKRQGTMACSIPSSPATASALTLLPEETISLSTEIKVTSAIPIL